MPRTPSPLSRRVARHRRAGAVGLACGAGLLIACAGAAPTVSAWDAPAITVDGDYADWEGRFTAVAGSRNVGLGVAHDRSDLYLCLVTRDLGVQSLLLQAGFTVWLDPQAGRGRVLGLRVAPVASEGEEAVTPRVEIVFDGAAYGYQLAELGPDQAIDVKSARRADVVVYELRVALGTPLTASARDAARATLAPGTALGVGVESGALPPPETPPGAPRRSPIEPLVVWVVAALTGSGR